MLINGVVLLDKPCSISSSAVLLRVKHLLHAKKAGHTGTLDPFATGLLPICLGEATKYSQDVLHANKTYEALIHLGVITCTGDVDGDVLSVKKVNVTLSQIEQVLRRFHGKLTQIPPMYSAIKYHGRPLYKYARMGIQLARDAREIIIYSLLLLSFKTPYLHVRVTCSKGTYIRVLSEDIGTALGCGAYLKQLRRISVGQLTLLKSITLDKLASYDHYQRSLIVLPIDSLLNTLPIIMLNQELACKFLCGQSLKLNEKYINALVNFGRVRVYNARNQCLLGTGLIQCSSILKPERLISVAHIV